MSDELREQLKEIYASYVPVIEVPKIEQAFAVGQLCFNLMQELNEDGSLGIAELLDICQEELGISRNLISNTALFYTWCVNNDLLLDSDLSIDKLYTYWEDKYGGLPTLAKLYRLILPKVEKKVRNAKIEGIKKNLNKYINDADYASIKLTKEGNLLLDVEGGL